MAIITAPHEFNQDDLYVDLRPFAGHRLYLKCEGFNFAGSVKLKAATSMVEMITTTRFFEANTQMMRSQDDLTGELISRVLRPQ